MANRHAQKKLRAAIRARMTSAGEPYQKAREHVLSGRPPHDPPGMDLVAFSYFGLPATLATIAMPGFTVFAIVPSSRLWGRGYPDPPPIPWLRAALRPRGVQ
jgi:hypothetical protein